MKRKRTISRLKRENKRLRKENRKLHDKHWEECRQIAKGTATPKDYVRMCESYVDSCENCPFETTGNCRKAILADPKTANEIISKWCAEHPEHPESVSEQPEKPKKTYKEDFLEKFPNAPLGLTGSPHGCVYHAYGDFGACRENCSDCWNEVMPDDLERGKD
ncbi:MAG: hypothetical protein IJ496_04540 [Ruminococcus sp.]|nr:hypothetical protein [Ruminococcus sp.]